MSWRRPRRGVLLDAGLWCVDTQRWLPAGPGDPASKAGARWDVWAAGPVLQQLMCPPGHPLANDQDVAAYARQLFAHYHGAAARGWAVAPWQSGAVRGASALAGPHFTTLQAALAGHAGRLRHLRPLWAAALHWAVEQQPTLRHQARAQVLLAEGTQLTWLQLDRGRCVDLRTARLAAPTWADVARALNEVASNDAATSTVVLGYGLADDAPPRPAISGCRALGRLDAAGPPAQWLDAARWRMFQRSLPQPQLRWDTRQRQPGLAWAALACAAVVFATAGLEARAHWQALVAGRALLQAEAHVANIGAGRPTMAAPVATPVTASVTAQMRASQAKLAEAIHRPWGQWLAGIESAAGASTKWLELDHDAPAGPAWRLRGQAADHASAVNVAALLAQQPGWRQARLVRLQANQGNGLPTFELQASTAEDKQTPP